MLRHALRSRLMFLIFSVGVLGSSASSAETRHAFGTVVSVEGAVYYVSPSLLRPTRLNGGEGITSTSVLQTQPHSSVRILFHTAVLTVGEDTLVEIAPSSEGAVQNGTLVISLAEGSSESWLTAVLNAVSEFNSQTFRIRCISAKDLWSCGRVNRCPERRMADPWCRT
jgi:hypothetical protein